MAKTVVHSLPNNWTPRSYQLPVFQAANRGIRRFCLPWHRRSGKDDVALNFTAMCMSERVGNYLHLLPAKNQARSAIWNAVDAHTGVKRIDQAFPESIRTKTLDQEMRIELINGSVWQVGGSDGFDQFIGSGPVGIVFSEYALSDPNSWTYLRPILAENDGTAMFISTVRGSNHFRSQYDYAVQHPDVWFTSHLSVEQTGVLSRGQIEEERAELTAERGAKEADSVIAQEYYSDWNAALPGSYYGEFMAEVQKQGRIGDYPWLPHLPVMRSWDIGVSDSTAIWWFQILPNGRIRIIDCLLASGEELKWYAKKCHEKPYLVASDIWPHDGNVREWGSGSRKTQGRKLGLKPRVLKIESSVSQGIQAVRAIMPLLEFNDRPLPFRDETTSNAYDRAKHARDCLSQYRRVWNEKLRRYNDEPLHDWTSNYADAMRYLARGRREEAMPETDEQWGARLLQGPNTAPEYAVTD